LANDWYKRTIYIAHKDKTDSVRFERNRLQVVEGNFPRDLEGVVASNEHDSAPRQHNYRIVSGKVQMRYIGVLEVSTVLCKEQPCAVKRQTFRTREYWIETYLDLSARIVRRPPVRRKARDIK